MIDPDKLKLLTLEEARDLLARMEDAACEIIAATRMGFYVAEQAEENGLPTFPKVDRVMTVSRLDDACRELGEAVGTFHLGAELAAAAIAQSVVDTQAFFDNATAPASHLSVVPPVEDIKPMSDPTCCRCGKFLAGVVVVYAHPRGRCCSRDCLAAMVEDPKS